MRTSSPRPAARGFTLVEILIVVVILGILAAVVIPRFASASNDAVKSALSRQLQTIDSQVELYRTNNGGAFPTTHETSPMGEDGTNDGWGIMVSAQYLKESPLNMYTGRKLLAEGTALSAAAETRTSENGWMYTQTPERLDVFAAGFDRETGVLSIELAE